MISLELITVRPIFTANFGPTQLEAAAHLWAIGWDTMEISKGLDIDEQDIWRALDCIKNRARRLAFGANRIVAA